MNKESIRALRYLHQMVEAELLAELRRNGDDWNPSSSLLGAIHRGRIAIFATMTIGEENIEQVVLKEITLGEGYA
jgi:hypothetical protein